MPHYAGEAAVPRVGIDVRTSPTQPGLQLTAQAERRSSSDSSYVELKQEFSLDPCPKPCPSQLRGHASAMQSTARTKSHRAIGISERQQCRDVATRPDVRQQDRS
jgi:hypothetical protein